MNAPSNWRGQYRDNWGRVSHAGLPIQAGEVAGFPSPKPHWTIHLVGPLLVAMAVLIVVFGYVVRT